jgi:hypothetical protein
MNRCRTNTFAVLQPAIGRSCRLAVALLLTSLPPLLLGGCQSLRSDWTPERWFWQQEDKKEQANAQVTTQTKTVNDLLARGNIAFTKDRLSVPADDNAVLYYRKVLDLDPANSEAQAGIKKVCKRYRALARIAHDNGDGKQAQKYLHQSEVILGFDHPANRKLRKELQETPEGQHRRGLDQSAKEKYQQQKERMNGNQGKARSVD